MGFAAGVDLFQTSNGKLRELQTILLLRWLFTPFWTSVSYLPAVPPDELDGMHIGVSKCNAGCDESYGEPRNESSFFRELAKSGLT